MWEGLAEARRPTRPQKTIFLDDNIILDFFTTYNVFSVLN